MTASSPDLQAILPKAENALKIYLNRYDKLNYQSAINRYQFILKRHSDDYWDYEMFSFSYKPIEKKGQDEIAGIDDDRRKYYPADWDGKTGYRIYKSPKDAIEQIPVNSRYGYRGMSWEEWRKISTTGQIQSAGSHNFGNQEGLTFFGYTPDTAESYAGGFAPMAFKPTPLKPGVIVAVPREFLLDHRQNPNIPNGELAHEGALPASHVAEVYMLVATKSKEGTFEVLVYRNGKVQEGSRSGGSFSYAIRRLK